MSEGCERAGGVTGLLLTWGVRSMCAVRLRWLLRATGDVHFAELLGNPPLELTSSGMTHTCGTTFWARACAPLIRLWDRHRYLVAVRGCGDIV